MTPETSNRKLAVSENLDVDSSPLEAKSFRKLYHAFVESDSCSPQSQRVDLPPIVPNVENHEHTLIHSKNVKPTHSVSCKDTLSVSHNDDHIRKHGRPIVIIKNVCKSPLKAMNNYLRVVSLPR